MDDLRGLRVAALATDGVEESELLEPMKALQTAGADVFVLSPKKDTIQAVIHDSEKGKQFEVDRQLSEANVDDYDAVLIPGGTVNADRMRIEPLAQSFLQAMQDRKKPFAVICHGPWTLVSAGLVKGRTLTSFKTLKDDITNAGGNWVDQEAVVDANWVSSRSPEDIPAFTSAMTSLFAAARQ